MRYNGKNASFELQCSGNMLICDCCDLRRKLRWLIAVRAAEAKQATDIKVLDLTGITSFADYFVICTGSNSKQIQAISDEVGIQLKRQAHELPNSLEGYNQSEWVLADYGDLLVHIFSPKAREYYGLERLWRTGKNIEIPPE